MRGSTDAKASTVPHHMSIAICLLLFHSFFVSPALPLSVSFFSQLLVIEGGRKQTQIKAQAAAIVKRLCVCAHNINKCWCEERMLRICFVQYSVS